MFGWSCFEAVKYTSNVFHSSTFLSSEGLVYILSDRDSAWTSNRLIHVFMYKLSDCCLLPYAGTRGEASM